MLLLFFSHCIIGDEVVPEISLPDLAHLLCVLKGTHKSMRAVAKCKIDEIILNCCALFKSKDAKR